MQEVLQESIRLVNLPLTACLAAITFYWLLVSLGALEGNLDGGDGIDLDDGGGGGGGTRSSTDASSLWGTFMQVIGAADTPLTIFASVLVLCMWVFSILYNHHWTGGSVPFALALLLPNFIASTMVTRLLLLPLRPVFRLINRDLDDEKPLPGRTCQITTSCADGTFGQALVETKGAPLLIHVRTADGSSLPKGATALIIQRDEKKGVYFVVDVSADRLT